MAFEGMEPYTIDLCTRCMGFIAYKTLGDWSTTATRSPEQQAADEAHAIVMTENLGVPLTQVTGSCGRECQDHGIFSIGFPDLEDWQEENEGTEEDWREAREAAWSHYLDVRIMEPWTSSTWCDGCGDTDQGQREHGTMYVQTEKGTTNDA